MLIPILLAAAEPKLPAWNAAGPPAPSEAAVMEPVLAVLGAISAGDGAAVMARVMPSGGVTAVIGAPGGEQTIRRKTWAEWAGGLKPGAQRLEERLTDPAIEVDGDIAMVWSPYVFLIDGKVHHCGVDHFDLIRERGAWKIQGITWSQYTTGCEDKK